MPVGTGDDAERAFQKTQIRDVKQVRRGQPDNVPLPALPLPLAMQGTFGPPVSAASQEDIRHIDNMLRSQFAIPYEIAKGLGWENVEKDIGPLPDRDWIEENPMKYLASSFAIPGAAGLGAAKLGYKGYRMLPPALQRIVELGVGGPVSFGIADKLGLIGP